MASQSRTAFTLIEMVVVMAIFALLMALIIPAVQSARESARRLECVSNLASIGKALHNHQSAHGVFPSAHRQGPPPESFQSWHAPHARLLPYLEQSPLFNQIDFQSPLTFVASPSGVGAAPLNVFLCPSDGGDRGNNYRVCTGLSPYAFKSPLEPGGGSGAFAVLDEFGPQDFTDGMSNTIAMSEKIKSYPEAVGWNRGAFWYSGIANLLGANPTVDQAVQECASLSGTPSAFGVHAGGTWYIFGYDHTFYNHTVTPNSRISDCSVQAFRTVSDAYGGVFQATSHHSGGVNCLLMDGSCRFVSNHIDLGIWRAFATRAGDELVGEL